MLGWRREVHPEPPVLPPRHRIFPSVWPGSFTSVTRFTAPLTEPSVSTVTVGLLCFAEKAYSHVSRLQSVLLFSFQTVIPHHAHVCASARTPARTPTHPVPSFASSVSCSFGKSTSKVMIKEPLMLLLSKLGSPSPFFHSLAPGLVILSREIWTWKAKGVQWSRTGTHKVHHTTSTGHWGQC